MGQKQETPRQTTWPPASKLGLSHTWPELGSNPQRWDDKRLEPLRLASLTTRPLGSPIVFWRLVCRTIVFQLLYFSQLMRLWYLSHMQPAKAQASLRIRAVSLEPSLFTHMKYGSRPRDWPKIRHLAPLDGCACTFKNEFTEDEKCHNPMSWLISFSTLSNPQQALQCTYQLFPLREDGYHGY